MSRRIITLLLWAAIGGLLLAAFLGNWQEVWGACRQPSMAPAFADLRTITGAIASGDQGFDPIVQNPMDPWNRPFNYPHVWLQVFATLGIDSSKVVLVGLLFAALYLATVSWLVLTATSRLEALLLGIAAVSHAALFAVERGNCDLLIFAMLVVGLRSRSSWLGALLLPVAALLKVYPAFALVATCCRRGRDDRWGRWWGALAALLTIGILVVQFDDIVRILQATPRDHVRSYGVLSLRALLANGGLPVGAAAPYLLGAVWLLCLVATAAGLWRPIREDGGRASAEANERLFVGFGLVYGGTFLVGSNYDYRLLMLLPTLPWLWHSFRLHRRFRDLLPVLLVLFVLYVDALGPAGLLVGHAAKVAVAAIMLHQVARIARGWLRPLPVLQLAPA